jgi:hypothetical protein
MSSANGSRCIALACVIEKPSPASQIFLLDLSNTRIVFPATSTSTVGSE